MELNPVADSNHEDPLGRRRIPNGVLSEVTTNSHRAITEATRRSLKAKFTEFGVNGRVAVKFLNSEVGPIFLRSQR